MKQEFQSYVGMLAYAEELSEEELDVWQSYKHWFIEAEKTGMTKSYKMVVLNYMLSKGPENWLDPITPEEAAPFFHQYLTEKDYRLKIDFSDAQGKKLLKFNEKEIASLIDRMPMTKWSGSAKDGLVPYEGKIFKLNLSPSAEENEIIYDWTKEIVEYRLHIYFERKADSRLLN